MSSSVGLERIACPACEREQFIKVRDLLSAQAIPCPSCGTMLDGREIEGENPYLARLLAILRQLDQFRDSKPLPEKAKPKTVKEPILLDRTEDPEPAA